MSKRLFDTNKWDKLWFRKLRPRYKCFWEFILSKCDISGVWDVDFETAEFYIGEQIDHSECLKLFKDQIYVMNDKKWFILDFFSFQNGSDLNEKSPIHKKIKETLIKHGLWDMDKNTLLHTVYDRVCNTPIVIVKEGATEKVKVKAEVIIPTLEEFLNHCREKLGTKFNTLKFSIENKYQGWKENGWKDGHNEKITNWKTKIMNTIPYMKPESNNGNGSYTPPVQGN